MNTMQAINLKPFCNTNNEDMFQAKTSLPFHQGGWTYATDRRIILRLPQRRDIKEVSDKPPDLNKSKLPWIHDNVSQWIPLPTEIPPLLKEKCYCGGDYKECLDCNGSGEEEKPEAVPVGGKLISNKYLLLIKTLPNPMLAPDATKNLEACLFKFDGGVGLIMPMRKD